MIKELKNEEIKIISGGNFNPVTVGSIVGTFVSGILFIASGSSMMLVGNRQNKINDKLRWCGLYFAIFGVSMLTGSIGLTFLSI